MKISVASTFLIIGLAAAAPAAEPVAAAALEVDYPTIHPSKALVFG